MDDLVAVSTLLQRGESNYVGWRVAADEPVNAWRSESSGNLHLYFRVERYELCELPEDYVNVNWAGFSKRWS